MSNGMLQYVSDTIVIETLADDLPMTKEAGLFEELGFSGVAASIISKVKSSVIEDDSPQGWLEAIGNMLISGSLFKLHPLLGITYAVANALGVDLIGIGKKVLSGVYDAIKGGSHVVMSDINEYGKVAFGSIEKSGQKKIDIPFLPRKGSSKIERVFGNLFRVGRRGKLRTLLVAILIWTLKTALLGAGIIGGAGLVSGLLKGKKKAPSEKPEELSEKSYPEKEAPKEVLVDQKPKGILTPSGSGTKEFKSDDYNVWRVPLYGDVKDTLATWAEDIYPQLSGYKSIMYATPSFLNAAKSLGLNYEPSMPNQLIMPKGITSRKQVVDMFAEDVAKKLQGIKL